MCLTTGSSNKNESIATSNKRQNAKIFLTLEFKLLLGLIHLDYDYIENVEELRKKIEEIPFT